MKTFIITLTAIAALSAAPQISAQKSTRSYKGETVTRTLKTGTIRSIEVNSGISVYYRQGPLKPVEVSAPAGRQNDIKYYMEGTKLYVEKVNGNSYRDEFMVTVQAPDINDFDLSAGCSLRFNGDYTTTGTLNLELEAGSSVAVNAIKAANITLELSAGCNFSSTSLKAGNNIKISTQAGCNLHSQLTSAKNIDIDASAAAKINLLGIDADKISVDATGVSTVTLAGKCNTLSVERGIATRKIPHRTQYNEKSYVVIGELTVKNRSLYSSYEGYYDAESEYTYDDSDSDNNYYNYDVVINGKNINDRSYRRNGRYDKSTRSYRSKTDSEKVDEAIELLRSLGYDDEAIRHTLEESGLSTDKLDKKVTVKTKSTNKTKKVYTEDDLVP